MRKIQSLFSLAPIETIAAVKALAITLVVANHSEIFTGIHGGLNVLMVVSGIAMATFAFNGTTKETLLAFKRFALRLAIPSFLIALVWATYKWNFQWKELAFISNWFYKSRVVPFPIWYVQVIVQLTLFFSLIFWHFDLTPKISKKPVQITLSAFLISVVISVFSYSLWNTGYLEDKLPQLLAWNFIFGWLFWALLIKNKPSLKSRALLTFILLGTAYFVYIGFNADHGESRVIWLSFFGLLLLWVDSIKLPVCLARPILLISQATFYIFLLHHFSFGVIASIGKHFYGLEYRDISHTYLFIAGVTFPTLFWVFVTACIRAYKKTKIIEGINAIRTHKKKQQAMSSAV